MGVVATMKLAGVLLLVGFLQSAAAGFTSLRKTAKGETIFELGNVTYFANTEHPAATLDVGAGAGSWDGPITLVQTNASTITGTTLEDTLSKYVGGDDVFSMAFTSAVLVKSSGTAVMQSSAMEYLAKIEATHIVKASSCSAPPHQAIKNMTYSGSLSLPPGPYFASFKGGAVTISKVYRLYEDTYRDFLYGAYASDDSTGSFASLGVSMPQFGYPAIPVPSRIYFWNDPRPFAGYRVAIKDLFDMKGLVTTGGSQAWALVNPVANSTAPSTQRILDLGGVLVGKYKLAQFASGANPWDWQDEYGCSMG